MRKNILLVSLSTVGLFFFISPVLAHVVVKPSEVGIGSYQTFVVGVPVEKDVPTVAVKLLIPDGVQEVTPNVKPGWKIDVKKTGSGEDTKVTEIDWTGGSIPVGQRDEFMFSVQVPAEETTLAWKAYQTYQDGTIVAWDQAPASDMDHMSQDSMQEEHEHTTPYSVTTVVNDLKPADQKTAEQNNSAVSTSADTSSLWMISIVALILAIFSVGLQLIRKK